MTYGNVELLSITRILAYYKSKENLKVNVSFYSTYSPSNEYLYYNEPAVPLYKKQKFYLAVQFKPPQLLTSSSLKKIQGLTNFFSVWERHQSDTKPDLVNRGRIQIIRTINHELFTCQHAV